MSKYKIINMHWLEIRLAGCLKKVKETYHHCPEHLESLVEKFGYDEPRYVWRIYDTGNLYKTVEGKIP